MQIFGPSATVTTPKVHAYGTHGAQALDFPGGITLLLSNVGDCDRMLIAIAQAKDAMVRHTQEREIAEAAERRQQRIDEQLVPPAPYRMPLGVVGGE